MRHHLVSHMQYVCGAKSTLRGFTDSLRSELIHDKRRVRMTMVQLFAFNTPQFDWGRTCFDKQPQPVPPIFQPELQFRLSTYRRAMAALLGAVLLPTLLLLRFMS